jgi:hypothetical protein
MLLATIASTLEQNNVTPNDTLSATLSSISISTSTSTSTSASSGASASIIASIVASASSVRPTSLSRPTGIAASHDDDDDDDDDKTKHGESRTKMKRFTKRHDSIVNEGNNTVLLRAAEVNGGTGVLLSDVCIKDIVWPART